MTLASGRARAGMDREGARPRLGRGGPRRSASARSGHLRPRCCGRGGRSGSPARAGTGRGRSTSGRRGRPRGRRTEVGEVPGQLQRALDAGAARGREVHRNEQELHRGRILAPRHAPVPLVDQLAETAVGPRQAERACSRIAPGSSGRTTPAERGARRRRSRRAPRTGSPVSERGRARPPPSGACASSGAASATPRRSAHGDLAAQRAVVVDDDRIRDELGLPAGLGEAPAEIRLLGVHEEPLVEAPSGRARPGGG